MKRQLKKWMLRLTATTLLVAALLLVIVLNPVLTYANETSHGNFTIYHNEPLQPEFTTRLDDAFLLVQQSEFYREELPLDICLNDGSAYPKLMKALRGDAFAWGFYNKVVLQGKADCKKNFVELNGYKWNMTQLLAHEMTHCLQFDKLGFWGSKPVVNFPEWKWEGYAEYLSRKGEDQKNLEANISRLLASKEDDWGVSFSDSTIAPKTYYGYWLLLQFCLDVKKMSYQQLLSDTASQQAVQQQMMNWYESKRQHLTPLR